MTPEQLETLILTTDDVNDVQRAFAPLTESERKSLSSTAQSLQRQIFKNTANANASEQFRKYIEDQKAKKGHPFLSAGGRSVYSNITLASFALCPPSALKKRDLNIGAYNRKDALEQIIVDRKPDWLDEWVAFDLGQRFSMIPFSTLRRWIREGLCRKPDVEGYYRMLASNLMIVRRKKDEPPQLPLSRRLLAEPDMLEDIWRLFEIETFAFNTGSWITRNAPEDYETWPDALIRLSKEGHLDRARLLDASLKGLHQDLKQNLLSGFHKFHERLEPTKEERAERQPEYLSLLCHKTGHVVRFVLGMLSRLEKDKALDTDTFLAEAQSVFFQENKSNAIAALKLVGRIVKRAPASAESGMNAVIDALRHSDRDVQKAALELMEEQKNKLSDALMNELRSVSDYVAASNKNRLLALIGESEVSVTPSEEKHSNKPQGGKPTFELQQTAAHSHSLTSCRVDYTVLSPNILHHGILTSQQLITPIENVEELINSVSHAVEVVESPDEVERILDGISRLCNDKPSDFAEKTAPLLHRMEKGGGFANREGIAGGMGGIRFALADLLLTWLKGQKYSSPNYKYFSSLDSLEPSLIRIRAITNRIASRQAHPTIAAPTHTGGWIDPLIWVKRLIEAEKAHILFDRTDFCFSLLRLAPDHRSEALGQIQLLSKELRRIAEFALGGNEKPVYSDRKQYDLWISAARARDPYADWKEVFEPLVLDDPWADSVRPASYEWRAHVQKHSKEYNFGGKKTVQEWKTSELDVNIGGSQSDTEKRSGGVVGLVTRAFSSKLATDWKMLPSAALNHLNSAKHRWSADLNTSWVSRWLIYQWPLRPDGAYLTGAKELVVRLDMDGSNLEPKFGFFYGLFQKNRPWHEAAHLLLSMGLMGKDADSRGLAIDALIGGIESRNLDVGIFASTLVRISHGGWPKLKRLGDNLLQVSQISPLHAQLVGETIQRWLPQVDPKQHNYFRMLEVLLEVQSAIRQPLKPEVIEALKAPKAGGKVAKLVTELIRKCGPET